MSRLTSASQDRDHSFALVDCNASARFFGISGVGVALSIILIAFAASSISRLLEILFCSCSDEWPLNFGTFAVDALIVCSS